LKKVLEGIPDDTIIVLQKDSEGNGYSPLAGADNEAVYIPDTTWSGEVTPTNGKASDWDMTEEEYKELQSKPRCLVLWPIN
jgi:hypothetical protein